MRIKKIFDWWGGGGGVSWYVRPSGGSYGTEDGTSYANAWDGFSNINWSLIQPGETLYIAGTHTTALTVGKSGTNSSLPIYIASFISDPGIIDCNDTLTEGFLINSNNYIVVDDISVIDATTSCVDIRGTSLGIIFNSVTASGSGNQGFQNLDTVQVIYNDCIGTDCVDDGLSLEGAPVVTANNCTFTANNQGVNAINTSIFVANNCTWSGNITVAIQPDSASDFTINDSFITGAITATSSVNLKLNRCRITDSVMTANATGNIIATECRVVGASKFLSNGSVPGGNITVNRCYISSTTTRTLETQNNANITANYCVLKATTDIYLTRHTAAGGVMTLNNCTCVGIANVGRTIEATQDAATLNNCISLDLSIGYVTSGSGVLTINNGCRFDITTVTSGINITQNSMQTTDPLLVDVGNDNFAVSAGSPCLLNGTNTGVSTGIASANWGDASNTPVVVTAEQPATYTIGAYI